MAHRYLPPRLLSQIPIDLVPLDQLRELITLVVAKCDDVLSNDGAIHPTLLKTLAEEAAREIQSREPPTTDGVTLELGERRLWVDPDADPDQVNGIYEVTSIDPAPDPTPTRKPMYLIEIHPVFNSNPDDDVWNWLLSYNGELMAAGLGNDKTSVAGLHGGFVGRSGAFDNLRSTIRVMAGIALPATQMAPGEHGLGRAPSEDGTGATITLKVARTAAEIEASKEPGHANTDTST